VTFNNWIEDRYLPSSNPSNEPYYMGYVRAQGSDENAQSLVKPFTVSVDEKKRIVSNITLDFDFWSRHEAAIVDSKHRKIGTDQYKFMPKSLTGPVGYFESYLM